MAASNLDRLHERIDKLGEEMREGFNTWGEKFNQHLIQEATCMANCQRMAPIVLGKNGEVPPISERINGAVKLAKEAKNDLQSHKSRVWKMAIALVSVVGAVVAGVIEGLPWLWDKIAGK